MFYGILQSIRPLYFPVTMVFCDTDTSIFHEFVGICTHVYHLEGWSRLEAAQVFVTQVKG